MMGMWKAVRMLRVIILTIGWLVFSYSQTTSVHADEDVNPPAGSPSAPDYLEGKLAAGTYAGGKFIPLSARYSQIPNVVA